MKPTSLLLAIFLFWLVGCASDRREASAKHLVARITYYNGHEDHFGKRVAMSNWLVAVEGKTVAASKKYVFGQKIFIPKLKDMIRGCDGHLIVMDRGRFVEQEKASQGQSDVFDVFLDCPSRRAGQRRANELSRKVGYYADVYVE